MVKKSGRPRKVERPVMQFRVSLEIYNALRSAASKRKISISREVENRLEASLGASTLDSLTLKAIEDAVGRGLVKDHTEVPFSFDEDAWYQSWYYDAFGSASKIVAP